MVTYVNFIVLSYINQYIAISLKNFFSINKILRRSHALNFDNLLFYNRFEKQKQQQRKIRGSFDFFFIYFLQDLLRKKFGDFFGI